MADSLLTLTEHIRISAANNNKGRRKSRQQQAFKTKLENRLHTHDLELIEAALTINTEDGIKRQLRLNVNQFCHVMNVVLKDKGSQTEDKLCSHILLQCYEKDDKIKVAQIPQWKENKHIWTPHRDTIVRIDALRNPHRYITISREGHLCMWELNNKMHRSFKVQLPSAVKSKDLWVIHYVPMHKVNKIAIAFTSKEIGIYDLNPKSDFSCVYVIQGLDHIPLCLDFWNSRFNNDDLILAWGDVSGMINAVVFSSASISLFDRPSQPGNQQQDPCLQLTLKEIKKGVFKNVRLVHHHGHDDWVRQVKYAEHLDCFISCATTEKNSLVLGWIEKSSSVMRTTAFHISQGVNSFDYSSDLNLIATAGVNYQVCLWNPYVISKPVGLLVGHMASVVHVIFNCSKGQLISLSKDKVLRIWDTQLQICIQRLTGVFPKGPEVQSTLYYDEVRHRLYSAFNNQFSVMEVKIELKDRVMSHNKPVIRATYCAKYNQVISVCHDGDINIWRLDNGQRVKQFTSTHDAEVTAMTLDQYSMKILTASVDGIIKVWDFNGQCSNLLVPANGSPIDVSQIQVMPRKTIVIGWERYITVFRSNQMFSYYVEPSDWRGGQEHSDDILVCAYCPPSLMATASYDGEIIIWNANSENFVKHLRQRCKKINIRRRANTIKLLQQRKVQLDKEKAITNAGMVLDTAQGEPVHSKTAYEEFLAKVTEDDEDEISEFAIAKLSFLEKRVGTEGADLVSCGRYSWVRFWSSSTADLRGEFISHPHAKIANMGIDPSNHYLATGDLDGMIKIWNIANYCTGKQGFTTEPPPMKCSFQPHVDTISSIELFAHSRRVYVLTSSADCGIALWDVEGTYIGMFGQETVWSLGTYRELTDEEQEEINADDDKDDEAKPNTDASTSLDLPSISSSKSVIMPVPEIFDDDASVLSKEDQDLDYQGDAWDTTILGKTVQRCRSQRRERRQPHPIKNIQFLQSEKSAGAKVTARLFTYLDCPTLNRVGTLHKPDFVQNPLKYFGEKSNDSSEFTLPEIPLQEDEIKRRFDEKSLFPKYIIDYHNKMKVSSQFMKFGEKHAKNRRQSVRDTRHVNHPNNVHFSNGTKGNINYQDSKYDLNSSNEFSKIVLDAKNAFLATSRQSKTSHAAFRRNTKNTGSRATQRLRNGYGIRDNVYY
ncbi:uncharacterized protein TRIADDRAFT_55170 [Trichoplax adhaerens]|uniref:WD repeat-containing protein 49 n=1 Tax=Trichoplax adhaerens TaxID=10228 RepID=B3RU63_TRIAD|nr:hypothetical protein TRIADDRAFT_55170 [Trichoplax adhaerens]EDV25751.1 hypothetical protein TRIADDRAFT_55170 [Trichoplax adhaerens]|eukprot:XP_002111784.1 hypothetical protein TRIADDRAFT_55170 [Trichoplax adhaerens]